MTILPFPDSYWVVPELFLAGEYPGEATVDLTRARLKRMLDLGIRHFIDLTEPSVVGGRLYWDTLKAVAEEANLPEVAVFSQPIFDLDIPSGEQMKDILDRLDASISARIPIYIHCWAGIGRTGTAVGCYLVRHGMTGDQALEHIQRLRADVPGYWFRSPETYSQCDFVRNWQG